MKYTVKDFMTELPHTVGTNASLQLAQDMMAKHNCHHLPVLEGGHLVGVVSEKDLVLMKLTERSHRLTVADVMTDEPFVVDRTMAIKDVASEMLKRKVGSAIVSAKEGQPWGIFTVTDALKVVVQAL